MKTLLAVAALAAAAASPAWAEMEYAQARTLGFTYELIDLEKTDGVTPAITFTNDGGAWQFYRIEDTRVPTLQGDRTGYGTLDYSARGAGVELTSGAGTADAFAVSTNASVLAYGEADSMITFTLTPWSAVIFHVPYTLSASMSELGSRATASLGLTGMLYDTNSGYGYFSTQDDLGWTGSKSGSLTGELAAWSQGTSGYVMLSTYAVAAVVPEPSTYAMLLAGLGAVAAWRRRRHGA